MEFKCKYCNGTKYRQISVMVKQCEECGRQIASEGIVDDKLDFSEERIEVNLNEIKVGEGLWEQLKTWLLHRSRNMDYRMMMES